MLLFTTSLRNEQLFTALSFSSVSLHLSESVELVEFNEPNLTFLTLSKVKILTFFEEISGEDVSEEFVEVVDFFLEALFFQKFSVVQSTFSKDLGPLMKSSRFSEQRSLQSP